MKIPEALNQEGIGPAKPLLEMLSARRDGNMPFTLGRLPVKELLFIISSSRLGAVARAEGKAP